MRKGGMPKMVNSPEGCAVSIGHLGLGRFAFRGTAFDRRCRDLHFRLHDLEESRYTG